MQEEVLQNVIYPKQSDAQEEARLVDGQVSPVHDQAGNITGYKVFGRAQLTISEKLSGVVQGSGAPGGTSDISAGVILGDTIELTKGKQNGQYPIDYERITAMIPEEYQEKFGSGSLSFQQKHGDKDFKSRELQAQYSLPTIGGATASVRGGVRKEERNIGPEQIQRLFQKLLWEQNTRNLGASVEGPIGKGVASLDVNRMWGDTDSSDFQPITSVGAQYQIPMGVGETIFSADYMQRRDDPPHWQAGVKYDVDF